MADVSLSDRVAGLWGGNPAFTRLRPETVAPSGPQAGSAASPHVVPELWAAYKVNLDVLNSRINHRPDGGGPIDPEVPTLLADPSPENPPTFHRLYEAEQRLADLMSDAEVRADAVRRFVEAGELRVPTTAALATAFQAASTDAERKAVYVTLIEDLHFRYQKRTLDRRHQRATASRLNLMGYVFLLPAIAFLAVLYARDDLDVLGRYHVLAVSWCGLTGAYLSRMIALHQILPTADYDTLVTEFAPFAVILRLIIGTLGAIVMYFLVVGDLVGGELFPKWNEAARIEAVSRAAPTGAALPVSPGAPSGTEAAGTIGTASTPPIPVLSREFAKLLIWSLIAGFSERLIPDRLAALERKTAAPKP